MFIDERHHDIAEHNGEPIPDVELSKQLRAWPKGRHSPDGVYVPAPEYIFLAGIAGIASLLAQGKLIVTDRRGGFAAEITAYEWDAKASDKGEYAAVKCDDPFMDAAR